MAVKLPRPPLSDLIDHIDHMVKVAGVDHVGLGSDFDGIDCSPQGIDSAADLPKITQALYDRGYKAADLDKILGGNLMRVFGEVEKLAKQIQAETNPRHAPPKLSPPPHRSSELVAPAGHMELGASFSSVAPQLSVEARAFRPARNCGFEPGAPPKPPLLGWEYSEGRANGTTTRGAARFLPGRL